MRKLFTIGLTGGICSGKSTLIKYFETFPNIKVLSFDQFTPIIYKRNLLLKNQLTKNFGSNILINDEIDRKILGSLVFSDESRKNLKILNQLVSIELRNFYRICVDKIVQSNNINLLIVEGPTIIESGFYTEFDKIWVTYANEDEIKQRFLDRCKKENNKKYDLLTLQRILQIQYPIEKKMMYSDVKIDTSGTIQETRSIAKIELDKVFLNLKN